MHGTHFSCLETKPLPATGGKQRPPQRCQDLSFLREAKFTTKARRLARGVNRMKLGVRTAAHTSLHSTQHPRRKTRCQGKGGWSSGHFGQVPAVSWPSPALDLKTTSIPDPGRAASSAGAGPAILTMVRDVVPTCHLVHQRPDQVQNPRAALHPVSPPSLPLEPYNPFA